MTGIHKYCHGVFEGERGDFDGFINKAVAKPTKVCPSTGIEQPFVLGVLFAGFPNIIIRDHKTYKHEHIAELYLQQRKLTYLMRKKKPFFFIKQTYRFIKWSCIQTVSLGRTTQLFFITPSDIKIGQTPDSQFQANSTYRFVRSGDWDKAVIPVKEHMLYISFQERFMKNKSWQETIFYRFALEQIHNGLFFRGEHSSQAELDKRFSACDRLYADIKDHGYKSNRQRYIDEDSDNILSLLDEITVNVARDGTLVLNDGWHRFSIAHILGIPMIPVRILVRHSLYRGR